MLVCKRLSEMDIIFSYLLNIYIAVPLCYINQIDICLQLSGWAMRHHSVSYIVIAFDFFCPSIIIIIYVMLVCFSFLAHVVHYNIILMR
jgi:hypothetical protein